MATVQFLCPSCQQASQVDASVVGQSVKCPMCGLLVTVTAPLPAEPSAPFPPQPPTPSVRSSPVPPVVPAPNVQPPTSQPETSAPKTPTALHRMSHAEKVRRRQQMNVIMLTVGLGVLIVALVVLVHLSGG